MRENRFFLKKEALVTASDVGSADTPVRSQPVVVIQRTHRKRHQNIVPHGFVARLCGQRTTCRYGAAHLTHRHAATWGGAEV